MKVKGLVFLGTRTSEFDKMVGFARDVLGLSPRIEGPDFAVCELPNGDKIEIFGPRDKDHDFMTCPVAGFLVEDVEQARAEMEAKGIEFIGPVQRWGEDISWSHFRAPDGHVYEITNQPS